MQTNKVDIMYIKYLRINYLAVSMLRILKIVRTHFAPPWRGEANLTFPRWLGDRDSNPNTQDQNLMSYH